MAAVVFDEVLLGVISDVNFLVLGECAVLASACGGVEHGA